MKGAIWSSENYWLVSLERSKNGRRGRTLAGAAALTQILDRGFQGVLDKGKGWLSQVT